MNNQNKRLYDHLLEKIPEITDEWLSKRKKAKGSIYSLDTDEQIERMLREQNTLTNKTITSALLEEQEVFNNYVDQWASIVAESRVNSDTPIYEVIEAVNKAQDTYMEFVTAFIMDNEQVTKEDVLRWTAIINRSFNRLITRFTTLYYEITKQRLFSQQVLIDELSIPIIPISDSVAVLPLIGNIDTLRAKDIYESIPKKCVDAKVENLYIDLSGIPIMDAVVAQQVYQMVSLLKILGISIVISGIRPEVAQIASKLESSFKDIRTFSSLKQALATVRQ